MPTFITGRCLMHGRAGYLALENSRHLQRPMESDCVPSKAIRKTSRRKSLERSALVRRYLLENGSGTIGDIAAWMPDQAMAATYNAVKCARDRGEIEIAGFVGQGAHVYALTELGKIG